MSDMISRCELFNSLATIQAETPNEMKGKIYEIIQSAPTIEPKAKVIAQVTFDEDKLREIVHEAIERIKEEYDIVDRPKGEWISRHNGYWKCSECGLSFLFYAKGNFCPNCGAKMKGADNE